MIVECENSRGYWLLVGKRRNMESIHTGSLGTMGWRPIWLPKESRGQEKKATTENTH